MDGERAMVMIMMMLLPIICQPGDENHLFSRLASCSAGAQHKEVRVNGARSAEIRFLSCCWIDNKFDWMETLDATCNSHASQSRFATQKHKQQQSGRLVLMGQAQRAPPATLPMINLSISPTVRPSDRPTDQPSIAS